jgi:phosphosulfolactate phosphohydrolase-like enzyme
VQSKSVLLYLFVRRIAFASLLTRYIISFIKFASHYKRIEELGLQEDLEYCCKKSIISVVPEYRDGKIRG